MPKDLLIKVCGMRDVNNIKELGNLTMDWMGLIFHSASSRYVGSEVSEKILEAVPKHLKKVGVFVHQNVDEILNLAKLWRLDLIQLHGAYTVEDAQILRNENYPIIKVFAPTEKFDWDKLDNYEDVVSYFLFDTAGKQPGGNGIAFDWEILSNYQGKTPYLLSGGIGPNDVEKILAFEHPQCIGIDLNSRFEDEPGLKNIPKIKVFIEQIKLINHA